MKRCAAWASRSVKAIFTSARCPVPVSQLFVDTSRNPLTTKTRVTP